MSVAQELAAYWPAPSAGGPVPVHLLPEARFPGRVALTFDDGPHPLHTPAVLDVLQAHGIKGTFFVSGPNVVRFPSVLRRIVADGHELGSHSWTHTLRFSRLTPQQLNDQLDLTEAAVGMALGRPYPLKLVRAPYGDSSPAVLETLARRGCHSIGWQVDSADWHFIKQAASPEAIDQAILDHLRQGDTGLRRLGGGVVVFHDWHAAAGRVLDRVIRAAIGEFGLQPTTTGDLLQELAANPGSDAAPRGADPAL